MLSMAEPDGPMAVRPYVRDEVPSRSAILHCGPRSHVLLDRRPLLDNIFVVQDCLIDYLFVCIQGAYILNMM